MIVTATTTTRREGKVSGLGSFEVVAASLMSDGPGTCKMLADWKRQKRARESRA